MRWTDIDCAPLALILLHTRSQSVLVPLAIEIESGTLDILDRWDACAPKAFVTSAVKKGDRWGYNEQDTPRQVFHAYSVQPRIVHTVYHRRQICVHELRASHRCAHTNSGCRRHNLPYLNRRRPHLPRHHAHRRPHRRHSCRSLLPPPPRPTRHAFWPSSPAWAGRPAEPSSSKNSSWPA